MSEKLVKTVCQDRQWNMIMLDKMAASLISNLKKKDVLIDENIYEEINKATVLNANDYLSVLYENLFDIK